jgi:hypothetical protein
MVQYNSATSLPFKINAVPKIWILRAYFSADRRTAHSMWQKIVDIGRQSWRD